MTRHAHTTDHLKTSADEWIRAIAREFGTDDDAFVLRAVRAWLHGIRDGLSVDACAQLGAQLPTVLRGVYYEGWDPSSGPRNHEPGAFAARYAEEASVRPSEAFRTAATVTAGLADHLGRGPLTAALAELPEALRARLFPTAPAVDAVTETPDDGSRDERISHLEQDLSAIREAVTELVRGLAPGWRTHPDVADAAGHAAHRAHHILMSASSAVTTSPGTPSPADV